MWSITCLLMAASIYPTIRGVFDVIAYQWASTDLDWLLPVLFTVAYSFYHQDVSAWAFQITRDSYNSNF